MQRGLTAEIAAADADPAASQLSPVRRRLRVGLLIGALLMGYVVALIALLPARFVFNPGTRWAVAGTVWNGEAVRDGAYRVEWRWAPWRSLATLGFAVDWRMAGSGTDLAGSAVQTSERLLLEGVSGTADGALLAAIAPDLPFACDAPLTVNLPRVLLAERGSFFEGAVRSDAGSCTIAGAPEAVGIPPLVARAVRDRTGVTTLTVAPLATPRLRLAEGALAGGRLTIAATPAGAAALPFLRGWRLERDW